MKVCVIAVDKGAKISFATPVCANMAKTHDVPDLDSALEKSFAEMKIGEENFANEEIVEDAPKEPVSEIAYGQKYTSENQSGKIIVKPIRATTVSYTHLRAHET